VLEGNYGGDPTKMPYVVNKEAFASRSWKPLSRSTVKSLNRRSVVS
jgi:hypothetical protein